jgi:hypothetical protein
LSFSKNFITTILEELGYLDEKKEKDKTREVHDEERIRDNLKSRGKKKSKLKQSSIIMLRDLSPIYLIRDGYAKCLK